MRVSSRSCLSSVVVALATLLTIFYAWTGLVYVEGGFACHLTLKPTPGWGWTFGGGEESAWARRHPQMAPPWWMRDDLTKLASCDWEYGSPLWVYFYAFGLLAVPLIWAGIFIRTVQVFIGRHSRSMHHGKR